ncbi:CHAD domain-containing protein [Aquabacterium sp.]|uniref:CYTH and CHAD domain-containing protein n=1 Tax=Aquabacterium sp. TaxID=1872578 RepID=UPI00378371E2
MVELELKFRVPPEVLDGLRAALLQHGARPLALKARYFDTADGRLAAHGMALRLRREDGDWVQTLKALGSSAVSRLEHEVSVPCEPDAEPVLDVQRHAGTAPGEALLQLLAGLEGGAQALVERQRIDVTRLRCPVRDAAGTEIEAALDEGQVRAAGREQAIVELELEHLRGPLAGLFGLAEAWVAHGGLSLCSTPKSLRGERLWQNQVPLAPTRMPRLPHHPDGDALMRGVLQALLDTLLAHASEVAEGCCEPERVHQLRVALRRLRTALRELAALCPALDPAWDAVLAQTFGALGLQRDADVLAQSVQPLLQAAGAPLALCRPALAGPAPDEAVRERDFQQVLLKLLALLHAEHPLSTADARAVRRHLRQRLDRLHEQVCAAGRGFEGRPIEAQHRARKRLKRLRYLAELVAPLWPADALDAYLARLKPAQDALGRHNDVGMAAAAFRDEAARDPAAWFAAGYLQAHGAVTGRAARRRLRALAQAPRFWR